jgi:hypothetical protein
MFAPQDRADVAAIGGESINIEGPDGNDLELFVPAT